MVESLDIVQLVDRAIARSERGQSAIDGESIDDAGLSQVAGTEVARDTFFRNIGHQVVKGNDGENALAEMHQHSVDREAVQPCGEVRVAAEGRELAVNLKEGFLGKIFGQGEVPDDAHADGKDALLVTFVNLRECLMIAGLGASYQFSLVLLG